MDFMWSDDAYFTSIYLAFIMKINCSLGCSCDDHVSTVVYNVCVTVLTTSLNADLLMTQDNEQINEWLDFSILTHEMNFDLKYTILHLKYTDC